MHKRILTTSLAAAAVVALAVAAPTGAPAQGIAVFDPANYAQNLLIAARTLQQVDQQIRSLQNEAAMLGGMAKNLARIEFPQIDRLRQKLAQIDGLMAQARGLDYRVEQLDSRFRQLFPEAFDRALTADQRVRAARARLDASMGGVLQTIAVQSQVIENIQDDAETLSAIVARSQGAEGALQAAQATNQLLALAAKQQFQLQQMMVSQFRSAAVEQARRLQESEEARAAARRFLTTRRVYTPR